MVDLGQLAVAGAGSERAVPGIAALRLSDLAASTPSELLQRHQRGPYHLVMLVSAGYGRHAIDFQEYDCRPGTLLWSRPGQVYRLGDDPRMDATMLLFADAALPTLPGLAPLLADPFARSCWLPAGEDGEAILTEVTQIATDRDRYRGDDPLGTQLLRHQLAVLLLRIATLSRPDGAAGRSPGSEVMSRFRPELESSFAATRRVEDYAARLGYSVRTLTRACLATTGRSAKQVVDARVALEARRLLACTDAPIAEVGRGLGFPEPTNFGRFFVRETGQTPGDFRATAATPRRRTIGH